MVHVIAMGNGVMSKDDQRKIRREWNKAISRPVEKRKLTPEQSKVIFESMGIKVEWRTSSVKPSSN